GSLHQPSIARVAQAAVRCAQEPKTIFPHDFRRIIRRAIINNDDFPVRIVDSKESFAAIANGPGPIMRANDHRDTRPGRIWNKWNLCQYLLYPCERRLGIPVAIGQPELPV